MNIAASGPNKQRSEFFRACGQAFEFLAVFYSLSQEQQEDLLLYITKLEAK